MSDDIWDGQKVERLIDALRAIPAETLRALRDLPPTLPLDLGVEVRGRLKEAARNGDQDLIAVDLRVGLLLALKKAVPYA